MKIPFVKYQGTGNDFVMIDNRSGEFNTLSIVQITAICDRKFGVGADGLIKINAHPTLDFEVDYYNADGSKSFCGNGARCSVAFAKTLGIPTDIVHFMAIDGEHQASEKEGVVSLNMLDVHEINFNDNAFILDTGSPHYIKIVYDMQYVDVVEEGRFIRYSEDFVQEGINVNFVQELNKNTIEVATYERGVEDETLSCGTGVTAAALAIVYFQEISGNQSINIQTKGGNLRVEFDFDGKKSFTNIRLIGPAERVFEGIYHA